MARQKIDRSNWYVCVRKCYFNLHLWEEGDETAFLPGIDDCPYFEKVE